MGVLGGWDDEYRVFNVPFRHRKATFKMTLGPFVGKEIPVIAIQIQPKHIGFAVENPEEPFEFPDLSLY
jgi:hypothetical protein